MEPPQNLPIEGNLVTEVANSNRDANKKYLLLSLSIFPDGANGWARPFAKSNLGLV